MSLGLRVNFLINVFGSWSFVKKKAEREETMRDFLDFFVPVPDLILFCKESFTPKMTLYYIF